MDVIYFIFNKRMCEELKRFFFFLYRLLTGSWNNAGQFWSGGVTMQANFEGVVVSPVVLRIAI